MLKQIFILFCFFFILNSITYGITFPIDEEFRIIRRGRILLTGWFYEERIYSNHKALDIPAKIHTPVRSVLAGTVIEHGFQYNWNKNDHKQAFGNYIKIRDDENNIWIYAHLTSYTVHVDDVVSEGQIIGSVGWTGLSECAPHLHLEKRNKNNKKLYFTEDFGLKFSLRKKKKNILPKPKPIKVPDKPVVSTASIMPTASIVPTESLKTN